MLTGICFVCGKGRSTHGKQVTTPWTTIYVDGVSVNAHQSCAFEYNKFEAAVSKRYPVPEELEEEFEQFDLYGQEGRPLNFNN